MIVELVIALVVLIGLAYWFHAQKVARYWPDRGVPEPSYPYRHPFGNNCGFCWDIIMGRKNMLEVFGKQYNEMKDHPFYGTHTFTGNPAIVVNDPDLLRSVLSKDFHHFTDRLSQSLLDGFNDGRLLADVLWRKTVLFAGGEEWKDIRSTFSPVFTSGKMKMMSSLIQEVSTKLVESLDDDVAADRQFDLRTKFGKYSMDGIASCAFGVDARSFAKDDAPSPFIANAQRIFRNTVTDGVFILAGMLPGTKQLLRLMGKSGGSPKAPQTLFFYNVIKTTVENRLKTMEKRNDLVDLMIQAMKDELEAEEGDMDQYDKDAVFSHKKKSKAVEMDLVTVGATALIMLIAGYDTTGQTLAYVGYILATHPEIQDKLCEEVDEACEASGGNMPGYAAIQEMEYLDMLIHETLRRYTAIGVLMRVCTEDYALPGYPNVKIKKDHDLHVPVCGIHMDPRYYPDPEKVIPERFSKEGKAKRHPYTFLPFGQGPRNCMGMRFALYEAKVGLVALLRKYRFVRTADTPSKVTYDPTSQLGASGVPLWVKIEKR